MIKENQMSYQVISIEQRPSKIKLGFFWLITFQNIKTQQFVETYVDPKMRNFSNWEQVIENADKGLIVDNLTVIKRAGKQIVDADSAVTISVACNRLEMDRVLGDWRDSNNPYNKLFG